MTATESASVYGFDPALPALPEAFDREAVERRCTIAWPGPDQPPARIVLGRRADVKYQPGRLCVVSYDLDMFDARGARTRTQLVLDVTPAGLSHWLYNADPALPTLRSAIDANAMRARFDQAGFSSVQGCRVTPIRYRPNVRCVLRYDLDTSTGSVAVFGKLLSQGMEQLVRTLTELARLSDQQPALPRVLAPVVSWPELGLLIQPALTHAEELHTQAFADTVPALDRSRWLRAAGAHLAALHQIDALDAPARSAADDHAELAGYLAPMTSAQPALAERYQALLVQLGAAFGQTERTLVPTHGAFRTDQFLIEANRLVMIDLDGVCFAEPERDAGNVAAYLAWKAIRSPVRAAQFEDAAGLIRSGYQHAGGVLDAQRLAAYEAASLLKIAGRRFRSLTVREWPLVPQLLAAAAARLDGDAAVTERSAGAE